MAQFYPEEVIQEVSETNDLVEIVSEYVKLKRSGSTLKGLCPFHSEKTPSFSVSPDKQLFHCFGCGAGGTVIHFIMKIENLDFVEAVKFLADRARIPLPQGEYENQQGKSYKQKQLLYEINVEAARFFHRCLVSPMGEKARKYLSKRKIRPQTIVTFGLGYAPDSWNALMEYLLSKGYEVEDMLSAGLIIKNNEKKSYYDRFRNRIMFPIINVRGNVIGFGGRVLDESLPKYLNSPETMIFNKSKNLYAMNFAKKSNINQLIIVEGYMDAIALHQNGIINTVASLGTALTREQAQMIRKYSDEVVIVFDSDAAGQAATLRGIDVLSESVSKVKIANLKGAKDPDEFIKSEGVEGFKRLIKDSKTLIEYKIDLLKDKYNIEDIEQKIEFVNEAAKVFAKVFNAVERDVYINKISAETGISTQAILSEIKKLTSKNRYKNLKKLKNVNKGIVNTKKINNKGIHRVKTISNRLIDAEKILLNLISSDKLICNKVRQKIKPEEFSNPLHKKLAEIIYKIRDDGRALEITSLVSKFEGEEVNIVTAILQMETNFEDNEKAIEQLLNTINKEKKLQKIKLSLEEGNVEKLNTLLTEYKTR